MLTEMNPKPASWKKYLLLWCIALVWFFPLSLLMEYQVACVWDPATHFVNQNRFFIGIFSNSPCVYWLSDLVGALWLKLCFDRACLYWWFHFGGSLITACNVTLWSYVFISAFKLPVEKIFPTGLFSTFILFTPFHLLIGYGTFPLFLLGLTLILLIDIASEKHIYLKLAALGIICAILPSARFNLLPFVIVPVFAVLVYYKEKRLQMVRYIGAYLLVWLVTYYAMNIISNCFVQRTESILSVDNVRHIVFCCLKFTKETLIKSFVVGLFMFFLLHICSKNNDRFFIRKLYWVYPIFTTVIYFVLRQYYAAPKADRIRAVYEMDGTPNLVNTASILEWDYKKYIVFPLFFCSVVIVLVSLLKKKNTGFLSRKVEGKRTVAVVLAAILIGIFCFLAGSNLPMRTLTLLSIILICFFSAVFQWMFSGREYVKLRFAVLSSLLVLNVLTAVESTVGMNFFEKEWHFISVDGCRMMLSNDLKRCMEYENASKIIRPHIKRGDCVFEFVPDYDSQWLPLTISLGGRFPFTYWSRISPEAKEEVQHILIWGEDSTMHRDDLCKYDINLLDWGKKIVADKNFRKTAEGEYFTLYSRQTP